MSSASVGSVASPTGSVPFAVQLDQADDQSLSNDDHDLELRSSFGSSVSTTASEGEAWIEEAVEEWTAALNLEAFPRYQVLESSLPPPSSSVLNEAACFAWPVDMQIDLDAWHFE